MKVIDFDLTLYLEGTPDEDIECFISNCDSCGVHTTSDKQELNLDFSGNADDLKKTLELINKLI